MSINKKLFKIIIPILFFFTQAIFVNTVTAKESYVDCEIETQNAFDKRICTERNITEQYLVLIPHKLNYFIGSHVKDIVYTNADYDDFESKFQISFKTPLSNYQKGYRCLWFDNTECYTFFGYTQISVWQMLNFDNSAPFRDTNFEPELIITQLLDRELFSDWRLRRINYGLVNHQSNGKTPPFSRSWNRSYIDATIGNDQHYITLKYWQRWNEAPKTLPSDFKGDDNPFIEDYIGNYELKYIYAGDLANYSIVMRDSEENDKNINYELNWSYPLNRLAMFNESTLRFYVQYFNGYGETLIDYNVIRRRLGAGIMLADWF